jgi:hypothetical protein
MGLGDGELPEKFRVEIDPAHDSETEVSGKRALLRLNSRRVYAQMGMSAQALEGMRRAAGWLGRLLDESDGDDRDALAPVLEASEITLRMLEDLSRRKAGAAARMEELLERGRRKARAARERLSREASAKSRRLNEFGMLSASLPGRGLGWGEAVPRGRLGAALAALEGMGLPAPAGGGEGKHYPTLS